jgi:hypothetical protein
VDGSITDTVFDTWSAVYTRSRALTGTSAPTIVVSALGPLLGDDAERERPELLVAAIEQELPRHVDSALVVRDHRRDEQRVRSGRRRGERRVHLVVHRAHARVDGGDEAGAPGEVAACVGVGCSPLRRRDAWHRRRLCRGRGGGHDRRARECRDRQGSGFPSATDAIENDHCYLHSVPAVSAYPGCMKRR